MKFRSFSIAIVFFLLFYNTIQAQLSINNSITAKSLVEDYLIGNGVEVMNVTVNGVSGETASAQLGVMTGSSNLISFTPSIVMMAGYVNSILNQPSSGAFFPVQNDLDLKAISGQSIKDAIVIEFDFRVNTDYIKFNYVFASREYPGFTCSPFNDAFGFFISGPGISGPFSNNAINIAVIPGTNTPVAVNTVNSGVPSNNQNPQTCLNANPLWQEHTQYFIDNSLTPPGDIQFPGLTQTFEASAQVQCGEWYHIKLAIGDAVDENLDSAVFLEAGSFASIGEIEVNVNSISGGNENSASDSLFILGCSELEIEILKPADSVIDSLWIEFGGTAIAQDPDSPIPGADYIFLENDTLFVFNPGADTLVVNIETIWDGIYDENEFLNITIYFKDYCGNIKKVETTVYFTDPSPVKIETEEVLVSCPTSSVQIFATAYNGVKPYFYDWGDYGSGIDLQQISVPLSSQDSSYFQINVTDACAIEIVKDSILVINNIPSPLSVVIADFEQPECTNHTLILNAAVYGGRGSYTYSWFDNKHVSYPAELSIVVENQNSSVIISGSHPEYNKELMIHFVATDTCGSVATDSVIVQFPWIEPLKTEFSVPDLKCSKNPFELTAQTKNALGEVEYNWEISAGEFYNNSQPIQQSVYLIPASGLNVYTLEVTDYCGRMGYDYFYENENGEHQRSGSAIAKDSLRVLDFSNMMNVITPNGDGKNDFFVIEGAHVVDEIQLDIFDRWGKTIYRSNNYTAGKADSFPAGDVFDGKSLSSGTYFYTINILKGECVKSGYLEILK